MCRCASDASPVGVHDGIVVAPLRYCTHCLRAAARRAAVVRLRHQHSGAAAIPRLRRGGPVAAAARAEYGTAVQCCPDTLYDYLAAGADETATALVRALRTVLLSDTDADDAVLHVSAVAQDGGGWYARLCAEAEPLQRVLQVRLRLSFVSSLCSVVLKLDFFADTNCATLLGISLSSYGTERRPAVVRWKLSTPLVWYCNTGAQ